MEDERKKTQKNYNLRREEELRFEVPEDSTVTIELISGNAEMFGAELALKKSYSFTGCQVAIFTWHGCELEMTGSCKGVPYVAEETPMVSYINAHAALDSLRRRAKEAGAMGPRAMVVGPQDSGKSTLCRTLLNYAVRANWKPTFVDLDVGQNSISIPGTVAATPVERPFPVEQCGDLTHKAPLVYFYGHASPNKSLPLYKKMSGRLCELVDKRCESHDSAREGGVIINTCGWVQDGGYQLLVELAKTFQADVLLVMGDENLYNQLKVDTQLETTSVARLQKSGGVKTRDSAARRRLRMGTIRNYFYGPEKSLCPHSVVIGFAEMRMFRGGGGHAAPTSALPLHSKRMIDPSDMEEVQVHVEGQALAHTIIAVSFADSKAGMMSHNIAGFLYVTNVDMQNETLTCLAPNRENMPLAYLLLGSIKWFDSVVK